MVMRTITIKKMAGSLAQRQQKKWVTSFHTGGVFTYCASRINATALKKLDADATVYAYRDALLFALSADLCARGDDLFGLWLRDECIKLFDDKGKPLQFCHQSHLSQEERRADDEDRNCQHLVNLDSLTRAASMTVRMLWTKDKRSTLSQPVHIKRIRRKHVRNSELKDTFTLMLRYLELTEAVRIDSGCQALFIGKCAKQKNAKATVCGGLCGKPHNLVANSLNSIRTRILADAKVDTKFTSHAIRGNAECAIVHAAINGASFHEKEGLIRSRHSYETHLKSYQRPPCPIFATEIDKLKQQGKLTLMTPEEVLRVGSGPHSFK
jgi:hypothetical protein